MAFKAAVKVADPVLLEPIMTVEVSTPDDYMGDVVGDLNSRRGQVDNIEDRANMKVISGKVPLGEMFGYATSLRTLSSGRAVYTMEFREYDEVPKNIQTEIIGANTTDPKKDEEE